MLKSGIRRKKIMLNFYHLMWESCEGKSAVIFIKNLLTSCSLYVLKMFTPFFYWFLFWKRSRIRIHIHKINKITHHSQHYVELEHNFFELDLSKDFFSFDFMSWFFGIALQLQFLCGVIDGFETRLRQPLSLLCRFQQYDREGNIARLLRAGYIMVSLNTWKLK